MRDSDRPADGSGRGPRRERERERQRERDHDHTPEKVAAEAQIKKEERAIHSGSEEGEIEEE
jgi:pre-mRNA-processing factor 40